MGQAKREDGSGAYQPFVWFEDSSRIPTAYSSCRCTTKHRTVPLALLLAKAIFGKREYLQQRISIA